MIDDPSPREGRTPDEGTEPIDRQSAPPGDPGTARIEEPGDTLVDSALTVPIGAPDGESLDGDSLHFDSAEPPLDDEDWSTFHTVDDLPAESDGGELATNLPIEPFMLDRNHIVDENGEVLQIVRDRGPWRWWEGLSRFDRRFFFSAGLLFVLSTFFYCLGITSMSLSPVLRPAVAAVEPTGTPTPTATQFVVGLDPTAERTLVPTPTEGAFHFPIPTATREYIPVEPTETPEPIIPVRPTATPAFDFGGLPTATPRGGQPGIPTSTPAAPNGTVIASATVRSAGTPTPGLSPTVTSIGVATSTHTPAGATATPPVGPTHTPAAVPTHTPLGQAIPTSTSVVVIASPTVNAASPTAQPATPTRATQAVATSTRVAVTPISAPALATATPHR